MVTPGASGVFAIRKASFGASALAYIPDALYRENSAESGEDLPRTPQQD